MLVVLVFLALLREPRAEGATRVSQARAGPGAGPGPGAGGQDDPPQARRARRGRESRGPDHGAGPPPRRHTAGRARFLYADGHARAYFGTLQVPKMHVARLKFPGPATEETWVTDAGGDPVFMVIAEPSRSLAGQLRQVVGQGRRVTVCFDRGGWSPALFADITGAGFDLLTYRKGPAADLPGSAFTTVTCTDDRGRSHEYQLADTTVALEIGEGPRKGQQVTLRQVTRREPASGGATRQGHTSPPAPTCPPGKCAGG
jgi:prepilin-type processing-associated H-X9-DG protein